MEKKSPLKKIKKGGKVFQKSKREIPTSSHSGINLEELPLEMPCKNESEFFWNLWTYDVDLVEEKPIYTDRLYNLDQFDTLEELNESYTTYIIGDKNEDLDEDEDEDLDSGAEISCCFCFFKSEIKPAWEDSGNYHGGRFVAWIYSQEDEARTALEIYWKKIMETLIGGDFKDLTSYICGAKVLYKRESPVNKISLWCTDDVYKDPALQKKIRTKFEAVLKEITIKVATVAVHGFQPHQLREGYVE